MPPYDNRFRTWYAGQFGGAGGNPVCGGPNGGAGAAIVSGGGPGVGGWAVRSCCKPGSCLIKLCILLPPLEDDPPDPAAPIDELGDDAATPAIAEDADTPGDMINMDPPGEIGGATELIPAADFAIPAPESLIADAAASTATGVFTERP